MDIFNKQKILNLYESDNELINYISDILNIHIERLKIIEKNNNNSQKKNILNDQFILIINNNDIKIFYKNKELQEFQNNETFKIFIIFQDITQNNNLEYKKEHNKLTNSIIIINNINILNYEKCDEIRKIIDNILDKKQYSIEKWETNQNVNCLYFCSDNKKFNNNEKIKGLDRIIFQIISKVIKKLNEEYGIISTGDSGYCFRKIYGATRLHKDGVIINPVNNRLSVRKIRNMSVIFIFVSHMYC